MLKNQKTVLVTGASGGSGEAIAKAFLLEGAFVIASDIVAPKWETPYEGQLFRAVLDVTDEAAITALIHRFARDGKPINVLVNNAGIAIGSSIEEMETKVWTQNFTVNTTGTFLCTREVVKHLMRSNASGSIINVSSIAGKNGFPNSVAYCASKAAIIGLTRSLAVELGPRDITVNAICPGSVDTPMIAKVVEYLSELTGKTQQETRKSMETGIPMQRFQTPQDIAALVVFLASDNARNINGESINIDGGVVRD